MAISNNFKIGITNDISIMRCRLIIHLIKSCGATPVLIPMLLDQTSRLDHRPNYDTAINTHLAKVDELLNICDGLIFPGNKIDVHPSLYHASYIHPETQKKLSYDPLYVRQETEIRMAKYALEKKNMPVLAICGGMHLMNVVLGGSLNQHLPEDKRLQESHIDHYDINLSDLTQKQLNDFENHFDSILDSTKANIYTGTHHIKVAADSLLAKIYQQYYPEVILDKVQELSIHHQGCFPENLSSQLRAVAWSADGLVEAAEHIDRSSMFVLTQFHPECNVGHIAKGLIEHMVAEIRNT